MDVRPNIRQKALALLLFDNENCGLVRQALPVEVWSGDPGIYALSEAVYDYIDTYQMAPGLHSLDLVFGLKIGDDNKKGLLNLVKNIKSLAEAIPNKQYIVDSVSALQHEYSVRKAIIGGMERMDKGDIAGAEQFILDQMKHRAKLFSPSKKMEDGIEFLHDLATGAAERDRFKTGIPDLDKRGIGPARGELFAIQGPKKSGKSWAMHSIAKQVLLSNKKVLHISLENRWQRVIQRYFQTFFAYKASDDGVDRDLIVPSGSAFDTRRAAHSGFLSDLAVVNGLKEQIDQFPPLRDNLRIAEFPGNTLTIPQLKAYMDYLEVTEQFIPDVLVLDYGSIMYIPDQRHKRQYIGEIHLNLRGIAQERNIAVMTVVQTNREGAKEAWSDSTDVGEDFSIPQTVDNLITLNRTKLEAALGLARIWVSDARNAQDNFGILIVQNYATGQFCLASQYLDSQWEKALKDLMKSKKGADEERGECKEQSKGLFTKETA